MASDESSLTRRELGKAIVSASLGAAGVYAMTGSAAADPQGSIGNASDPASTVYLDLLHFHERSSDPSSPANGTMWYNSTA